MHKHIANITLLILSLIVLSCSSSNSNSEKENFSSEANYSEYAGIYQMYVDGEPLNQNAQMFYLLNAQGVVLTTFGESSKTAFLNVEEGLRNGMVTTGTYKVSGTTLTFDLEKSKGPTDWKINSSDKSISRDRASLHFAEPIQ